jgi:hypothetical protein
VSVLDKSGIDPAKNKEVTDKRKCDYVLITDTKEKRLA